MSKSKIKIPILFSIILLWIHQICLLESAILTNNVEASNSLTTNVSIDTRLNQIVALSRSKLSAQNSTYSFIVAGINKICRINLTSRDFIVDKCISTAIPASIARDSSSTMNSNRARSTTDTENWNKRENNCG